MSGLDREEKKDQSSEQHADNGPKCVGPNDQRSRQRALDETRSAIHKGLKPRKSEGSGNFPETNPYLDGLTDEEYRTVRGVFKKLGSGKSIRTIRQYRNEIAQVDIWSAMAASVSGDISQHGVQVVRNSMAACSLYAFFLFDFGPGFRVGADSV